MQFKRGRLIDHVHLRAKDLHATRRFYKAVFAALDVPITMESDKNLVCDELYIDALGNETASASHVHLAFQAADRDMVDRFYRAGRAYHPGYYAAFLTDPDGNNIEAVFHGAARRSAPDVTIEPVF